MGQDLPPKAIAIATVVLQAEKEKGFQGKAWLQKDGHTDSPISAIVQRMGVRNLGVDRFDDARRAHNKVRIDTDVGGAVVLQGDVMTVDC